MSHNTMDYNFIKRNAVEVNGETFFRIFPFVFDGRNNGNMRVGMYCKMTEFSFIRVLLV